MKLIILATMVAAVVAMVKAPLHTQRGTLGATNGTAINCTETPVHYGMILFRALDMLDVYGPLEVLQLAAHDRKMNLHLIAADLQPVTTERLSPGMNKFNSSFWPTIQPTATFDDDDLDLDVLFVPGGPGVRAPNLENVVEYVAKSYPKVKYLVTICTGASLAAKAGVLDGKRATTHKNAWDTVTAHGPNVKWVAPARWTVDGNVWTSSGVSSGLDLTLAFLKHIYGEELATKVANLMEHVPHPADWDPFTEIYGVEPTGN